MSNRQPPGTKNAGGKTRERRGHFRGKPRPGRRVDVSFQVLEDGQPSGSPQPAVTKNIGIGGAFILTADPPPTGTTLDVLVRVPGSEQPLRVRADVRWIVDGKHDEPEREFGMGVKFAPLDVEQLLLLNEFFASLSGGGANLVEHDEG